MRGALRVCTTGLATAVLAAGLTACTGGEKDEPTNSAKGAKAAVVKACTDGTFTWTGVRKKDRLTGVSEARRVAPDGSYKARMERVYTPRPAVRAAGPTVSPAEVLFSLGKRIGEIDSYARTLAEVDGDTYSFTDVHLAPPDLDSGVSKVTGPGENVEYVGVREWEGDFRYTCSGGKTTTGHARNWTVDISGILSCDESVDGDGLALQAARRSCAEGSRVLEKA
ncbi:MAG: hypothetical protein HOZ81_31850 [Streptomyces sp.]|nr:hypothetical protein [Streptomyces sp.]NUT27900.1 hypothetical protein [Streptomyces sp.]